MGQFMTTTRIAIAIVLFAATARGAVVVGDKPTLRVHTIDGTTFDLKDYKGKLVLVDFFFGRSDLDRAYHQHLLDLHNRQKDKGLIMVSICCAPKVPEVQQAIVDYKIAISIASNSRRPTRTVSRLGPFFIPRGVGKPKIYVDVIGSAQSISTNPAWRPLTVKETSAGSSTS